MRHFYDGQIRRYLLQIIRLMSNFVVRYGDGTLVQVPVMYGDQERQVAHLIKQNSENSVLSAPRIAVYVSDLQLDTSRLSDSSFVGKINVRERAIDPQTNRYLNYEGESYTIERLMPTPFRLTVKVDIWTTNTDQKLQLFEQICVLFNPSLEIQTTDNFVDWSSLTVVDLENINFSSRVVPTGTSDDIDVLTLTLGTPIYINPPAKVKRLGIITQIITNVFDSTTGPYGNYVDGLGTDPQSSQYSVSNFIFKQVTSIGNYDVEINATSAKLLGEKGGYMSWPKLVEQLTGELQNDLSRIYLNQPNGSFIAGYITLSPFDEYSLSIRWDEDSFPSSEQIPSVSDRANLGSFDAIIDPLTFNPLTEYGDYNGIPIGLRLLTVENIGGFIKNSFYADSKVQKINTNVLHSRVVDHRVYVTLENGQVVNLSSSNLRIPDSLEDGIYYILIDEFVPAGSLVSYELFLNEDGPAAWKNLDGSDFVAEENDIIEWDGEHWNVVFSAKGNKDSYIYLTNTFTNTQYVWNGVNWGKNFERTYRKGEWSIEL